MDKVKGGAIPKEYIPAVEAGVKEALETGVLAAIHGRYQGDCCMTAVTMRWILLKWLSRWRALLALKRWCEQGKPVLLEPIMKLEVVTPAQFMGDVIGDLNSRRGHIEGIETHGETCVVHSLSASG